MSPALLQRQAALAAGALLATLGVLALRGGQEQPAPLEPVGVGIEWEEATVGVLPARAYARETACRVKLDSGTLGIAHPLLPCGVDLVVAGNGKEIRTEVVHRTPVSTPVSTDVIEFELTQALANELGVDGEATVRWRFAG